jgi:hypothetical protein
MAGKLRFFSVLCRFCLEKNLLAQTELDTDDAKSIKMRLCVSAFLFQLPGIKIKIVSLPYCSSARTIFSFTLSQEEKDFREHLNSCINVRLRL